MTPLRPVDVGYPERDQPTVTRCSQCGHELVLSEDGQGTDTVYDVQGIRYSVHTKRDAPPDAPKTLRVDYELGPFLVVSEWVCFEHAGYPARKAVAWWRQRSCEPVPDTAQRAVEIAEAGGIAWTEKIVVRRGEKDHRIIAHIVGPKPRLQPIETPTDDLYDVPF